MAAGGGQRENRMQANTKAMMKQTTATVIFFMSDMSHLQAKGPPSISGILSFVKVTRKGV